MHDALTRPKYLGIIFTETRTYELLNVHIQGYEKVHIYIECILKYDTIPFSLGFLSFM